MLATGNAQLLAANLPLPDSDEDTLVEPEFELPNCIPACKISKDFWLSLRKRSVAIAENQEGHKLSLLDIKQVVCSEESRDLALHPELFHVMNEYYRDANIRVLQRQEPPHSFAMPAAMKVMAEMQDMRKYPALFAKLGDRITECMRGRGIDTEFLKKNVPLKAEDHVIYDSKKKELYKILKCYLEDTGFEDGDYRKSKLRQFCDVKNHMPYTKEPLPEFDGFGVLTEAMNSLAAEHGLAMDFSKTPIFLNFVVQDIADEILKACGFYDSPTTGNITHGMMIHACQILFGYMMGVLDEKTLADLVDERLFALVLDQDPNVNADFPVTLVTDDIKDESIAMVTHRSLLNGRTPTSFQNLLMFGLVSRILERGLEDDDALHQAMELLQLKPSADSAGDRVVLNQKILAIRALEYAIARITISEGTKAVEALARETDHSDLKCLDDLFKVYPKVNWGSFGNSDEVKAMLKGMVAYYLEKKDEFTVYQQWVDRGDYKLKPISSIADFIPDTGYVVYPAGAEPPEVCRLK